MDANRFIKVGIYASQGPQGSSGRIYLDRCSFREPVNRESSDWAAKAAMTKLH